MFIRFATVSVAISLIDAGGLYALHKGGEVNVYLARVCSYGAAITAGYFLNRRFTFGNRSVNRGSARELLHFYGVCGLGGGLNYGVFLLVLLAGRKATLGAPVEPWLPLLGVWLGGVAGMCLNYLLSSRLVFETQ